MRGKSKNPTSPFANSRRCPSSPPPPPSLKPPALPVSGRVPCAVGLKDDHFRDELTRLRQESGNLARQELQGIMLRSVSVFSEAMDHPDIAVRLRAARYALSFAVQICEVEKLRADIQALEDALPLWAAHHSLKISPGR